MGAVGGIPSLGIPSLGIPSRALPCPALPCPALPCPAPGRGAGGQVGTPAPPGDDLAEETACAADPRHR